MARNSGADANDWTRNPTDLSRLPSALRIPASSSTTNTTGSVSDDCALMRVCIRSSASRAGYQLDAENGAVRPHRRRRQRAAVRLDDRPADREAHAHAVRLGGEECVEEARAGV